MDLTHYEVLGVAPDAGEATIRAAYKRRARETHPDMGGDPAEFAAVTAAWEVLSDPDARAGYDADADDEHEGWGEDVGLGDRAPRTHSSRATDPPEAAPRAPVQATGTARPGLLPSMADELTWLPPPVEPASPVVRWVSAVLGLAITLVVLLMVEAAGGWERDFIFPLVPAGVLVLADRERRETAMGPRAARRAAAFALWSCVVLFPAFVAFAMVSGRTGEVAPVPVVATVLGTAGCLVVALLAERAVRRARRWYPAVTAMHKRRALAEAWDELLEAQELFGDEARVERRVIQGHWDPTPGWVLVEVGGGELLASAPAQAPEAWAATMRLAGVEIDPVPGQPAGV